MEPTTLDLQSYSERTRLGVERLRTHGVLRQPSDLTRRHTDSGIPSNKLAAVLVLLYEEHGELRVLLTTRSKLLRAHPGQTALPGGKADETDPDLVYTSRSTRRSRSPPLPARPHAVHAPAVPLTEPADRHAGRGSSLTDPTVLGTLTPSAVEVDRIFTYPLEAVLDPTLSATEPLVPRGSEVLVVSRGISRACGVLLSWLANVTDQVVKIDETDTVLYRHHRLRSCASPVKGLTADILICVAGVVYEKTTTYERHPPGQGVAYLLDLRMKQYRALEGPRVNTVSIA
ncbi:hypothetical protein JVU11DRAFT_4264 [Chiua virens]|nr:hypothetical protein JVU11DRAFT_4264 [Chiua virens]